MKMSLNKSSGQKKIDFIFGRQSESQQQANKMPTTLVLYYTASVTVTVPNKIARKLKEQEGVQSCENATWAFGNKWGDLYYQDEDGEEHMIEGNGGDCDYKRSEEGEWLDEEESGDEEKEEESEDEEKEEDDDVIPQCCNDANGCPQCCSEDEEKEEDGDGFVICSKCDKGGGKCDGECEESK
jgi:hypothetical protein